MKKSFIAFVLALLTMPGLSAQNSKLLVVYKVRNGAIVNHASLLSSGDAALFMTDSVLHVNKNILNKDEEGVYHIRQKKVKISSRSLYSKINSAILYLKAKTSKGTPELYRDSLPDYTWNLIKGETKKIGGFVCHKATTQFRGSKIVAWYTPKISIPFGPWKLKGLPGLILELYNPDGPQMRHWTAKTIKYPYDINKDFNLDPPINELVVIPYKDLIVSFEEKFMKKSKRLDAADPRGTKTKTSGVKRNGIEKKYEWEK